jgi:hypothetical protein
MQNRGKGTGKEGTPLKSKISISAWKERGEI